MKKPYQSKRVPVQDEFHLGRVNVPATTAFPTNSASWHNRQDAMETIKTNCFKSFGKCKLTIINTEEQEVIDYVKDRLERNYKINFSPEEVEEIKSLLERKKIRK